VGDVIAHSVAKWSGDSWAALAEGIEGDVIALATSGSQVYAGGAFHKAGTTFVNYVANWNGGIWSALGSGVNGIVTGIAASGTNVYVAGDFSVARRQARDKHR
jgi:N-acetylmuramic acid 6-phosphate (MurNAc-6-P) etherase